MGAALLLIKLNGCQMEVKSPVMICAMGCAGLATNSRN